MIFSVIVPFLNEERYIEKCVRALLEQDFDKNEYEIIFIDNGSVDSSAEIVRRYPEIILVKEAAGTDYTARNKGLRIAKGNIIAFTDADCAVSWDWLKNIYKRMLPKGDSTASIVLGKRFFKGKLSLPLKILENYENEKSKYVIDNCAKPYFFAYTNNMAVHADIFQETGGFSEKYGVAGDTELLQRCIKLFPDINVVFLDDMKIVHLEITTVCEWLQKIHIYGRYNWRMENSLIFKPLDFKTRLKIYASCARRNHYSVLLRIYSLLWMALGNRIYFTGRLKAKMVEGVRE